MFVSRCTKCKNVKPIDDFYEREDRPGLPYAWCKKCCSENGRSPDYPELQEQGSGVYYVNYKSLRTGYEEN